MERDLKILVADFISSEAEKFLVKKARIRIFPRGGYNIINDSINFHCYFGITSMYYIIYPYEYTLPRTITWGIVSYIERNLLISLYGLINRLLIPYQKRVYVDCYKLLLENYPVLEPELARGAEWRWVLYESGFERFKTPLWQPNLDVT